MQGLARDLRFAVRALVQRPAFSLIVIGMLALGIAGTTAIFSVFNGLFLRPLPFDEPDRLVNFDETAPKWDLEFVAVAYPDFHEWREQNRTFEAMSVVDNDSFNMALGDRVQRVDVAKVTHDMAAVLRIAPLLGRHITAEDDRPEAEKVVLLGEVLWRTQFGGEPEILGRSLRLDGEPYTVIGVLPRSAGFLGDVDLWVPLAETPEDEFRGWHLSGLGRLEPAVTPEQARADLHRVHKSMIEERSVNEITSPVVMPVLDRLIGEYRLGTAAMLGAVGLVLLIACANVAGLMLARSSARSREIGIRMALGASRRRVLRQLLTESLVLAAVGGVVGTALGYGGLRLLLANAPDGLPSFVHFGIDVRFLMFTVLIVVGVAVLFGLMPALQAARTDVLSAIHGSSTRASDSRGRRLRLNVLVAAEVALALVLLICAGLFARGFRNLQEVDPGFRPEGVLAYSISLPPAVYDTDEKIRAFFKDHLEKVRSMAGVEVAGAGSSPPFGGHWGSFFAIEGAPPPGADEERPVVLQRMVTPGYFDALGITLLAGRVFDDGDRAGEERVVIVNETFARRFFSGDAPATVLPPPELSSSDLASSNQASSDQWPVGKRIRFAGGEERWMTVVGVTRDVKHYGLDTDMRPGLYFPHDQFTIPGLVVVGRSSVAPLTLVGPLRDAVRQADPELPIFDVKTMSAELDESLWARRAAAWLTALFAGTALLLAVGGIYGVVSYAVNQRTYEIGIRMALGADRGAILRQVLRQGLWLASIGVGIGLVGAVLAARFLSSLLFGVSATEPTIYSAVTFVLAGVMLLATVLPARRAAGIEPMRVLRGE